MQYVASIATACKFESRPYELGSRLSDLQNTRPGCTFTQNGVTIGIHFFNNQALLGCSEKCNNKVRTVDGFAACGLLLEKRRD